MDRNRLGGNENGRAERAEAGEKPQAAQAAPRKKGAVLSWVIIAAAAVVLVFALVNIIGIKSEDMANEQTYEHLKIVAQGTAEETAPADPRDRKIDFAALAEVNEDIIAWLYIPNTKIDYPVVQGEDNDYYLTRGASKEENRAGAVFLDYRSSADLSDPNMLIYGHRMNDGSMFADLHQYEDENFFRENRNIYLYLPDGTVNVYDIFGAGVVGDSDEAYTISFADDEAFQDYLTKMKNRSAASFDMELSPQDRIITLSTCVRGEDTSRYIVQAKLEQ